MVHTLCVMDFSRGSWFTRFTHSRSRFTRIGANKKLHLGYSEAKTFMNSSTSDRFYVSKKPNVVEARAKAEVMRLGRNIADRTNLLGQFEIQFSQFKAQTFQWLVENGLGNSAWMVNSMFHEMATSAPLSVNKHHFKECFTLFPEGKEAFALKAVEKAGKANPSTQTEVSTATSQISSNRKLSTNMASLFGRSSLSPQALAKQLQPNVESSRKIQKSKPSRNIFAFSEITSELFRMLKI